MSEISVPRTVGPAVVGERSSGGWRFGRHGRIGCKRILAIELVARQDTQQRDHDQRMGQGEGEIIDHGMVLPAALLMPRG